MKRKRKFKSDISLGEKPCLGGEEQRKDAGLSPLISALQRVLTTTTTTNKVTDTTFTGAGDNGALAIMKWITV